MRARCSTLSVVLLVSIAGCGPQSAEDGTVRLMTMLGGWASSAYIDRTGDEIRYHEMAGEFGSDGDWRGRLTPAGDAALADAFAAATREFIDRFDTCREADGRDCILHAEDADGTYDVEYCCSPPASEAEAFNAAFHQLRGELASCIGGEYVTIVGACTPTQ